MDFFDNYPYDPYLYRVLCDDGHDDYPYAYYDGPAMVYRDQPYPPQPWPPWPDRPCPPWPEPHPPMPVCPKVSNDYYTYPQNLVAALDLVAKLVEGDCYEELFLEAMMKMAPSKHDKDMIAGMLEDLKKENEILRHIYCQITGERLAKCKDTKFEKPKSYCEGIEKSFMMSIDKVKKLRKVLYAMDDKRHKNMLVELITDSLLMIDKWDHLNAANECFESCRDDRNKKPR